MTTDDLASELAATMLDVMMGSDLSEGQAHRWERVARELARRDYRFRDHGRKCTCADCWMLWDTWTGFMRRALDGVDPPR